MKIQSVAAHQRLEQMGLFFMRRFLQADTDPSRVAGIPRHVMHLAVVDSEIRKDEREPPVLDLFDLRRVTSKGDGAQQNHRVALQHGLRNFASLIGLDAFSRCFQPAAKTADAGTHLQLAQSEDPKFCSPILEFIEKNVPNGAGFLIAPTIHNYYSHGFRIRNFAIVDSADFVGVWARVTCPPGTEIERVACLDGNVARGGSLPCSIDLGNWPLTTAEGKHQRGGWLSGSAARSGSTSRTRTPRLSPQEILVRV